MGWMYVESEKDSNEVPINTDLSPPHIYQLSAQNNSLYNVLPAQANTLFMFHTGAAPM